MTEAEPQRSKSIAERVADVLRDHAVPLPDDGYPDDEYDCCAAEVLANFVVVPRDGDSVSAPAREELVTVLDGDSNRADAVIAWLMSYGRSDHLVKR